MAYYLKYRSRKLDELDLLIVREGLKEIVSSGTIPHAFLFSGPKGTGKTSAARILAKIINCEKRKGKEIEPCNKCKQCTSIDNGGNIDVIELDAASNRGIDDIRNLRDAVRLSPANAKKKVYVIDEAHMLTTEASNALLKTLEEPPEHVVFVLATTNPEKLIETIRSRTTNIKFSKASVEEIIRSLKRVIKGEKIKADGDVLSTIAEASGGSFRDAHKLLEQLSSSKKMLTKKLVENKLGGPSSSDIQRFLNLLLEKDSRELLNLVEKISKDGEDIKVFIQSILAELKESIMSMYGIGEEGDIGLEKKDIIELIELLDTAYSKTGITAIQQLPLELAIIKWCDEELSSGGVIKLSELSGATKKKKEEKSAKKKGSNIEVSNSDKKIEKNSKNGTTFNGDLLDENFWKQVLLSVKPKNASTEALLRAAKPLELNGETLIVGVFYNFHKERLQENLHRNLLEESLAEVMGKRIRIECRLTEPPQKTEVVEVVSSSDSEDVMNEGSDNIEDSALTQREDDDIVKIAEEIFG